MRTRVSILRNAVPLLFLFSIFAAGSTYGYFIHRSEVFPYGALQEAKAAYSALRAQSRRKAPSTFLASVPATAPRPTATRVVAHQPDDWILVTGGPYEFLEECPRF